MPHKVTIVETGESYGCPDDESILRGMEKLGRKGIPLGCRGGGCGVCKVEVLDGRFTSRVMSREHVSAEDEQKGRVLACCVFPASELRVRVLGLMKKTLCRPQSG